MAGAGKNYKSLLTLFFLSGFHSTLFPLVDSEYMNFLEVLTMRGNFPFFALCCLKEKWKLLGKLKYVHSSLICKT